MTPSFRLMGIVNATPDSFSDGGRFLDPRKAVDHALALIDQGAAILDVGGESTRPGAEPVAAAEELGRVLPVVEGIASAIADAEADTGGAQISIDTSKASVARAALAAGASLVNDVSALRADPEMASLVAESGAECCLVHMQGEPRTMHRDPHYEDVVDEVKAFLQERLEFALSAGIEERHVLLDPGIGFGKTVEHNLALLARLAELAELGRPLVIGTSRKSFLARVAQAPPDSDRLAGTLATNVLALERGASVFRVHDVAPAREALAVAAATLSGRWTASAQGTTRTT
ncbi:MAG TPA: dihydropteroate synthase [Solirubrobacteraceae bacterium]|jgi:dihydropteroate synthase|nr:dihydropteroate synthase [Solirubrobacteraceae bacterium]